MIETQLSKKAGIGSVIGAGTAVVVVIICAVIVGTIVNSTSFAQTLSTTIKGYIVNQYDLVCV